MPRLGAEAAERLGVDLSRLVLIPDPGARWLAITAVAIAVALLMLAARPAAAADPLSCGDTITTDTTLQAELSCLRKQLLESCDGVIAHNLSSASEYRESADASVILSSS